MGVIRIPYTSPLPDPIIYPATASTLSGAIAALYDFLDGSGSKRSRRKTVVLTGAGISVASGLADYRGTAGTYTLNKTYRPIYYHEFTASHEARKRYWARSFLGWTNLHKSRPNATHHAIARLGELGHLSRVITQNVDSFHRVAHPDLDTIELHGYLRSAVCLSCRQEYPREAFQKDLAALNPSWRDFLAQMLDSGALTTENPDERRRRGLKTNPDGDVDVPGVKYETFKYPPCPSCASSPPRSEDGSRLTVEVGERGDWLPSSTAGVLKPNVIMFGESIPTTTKANSEAAIDEVDQVLVVGSSLATYSAWRLIKKASDQGKPIAIANLGGVRGEEQFFARLSESNTGYEGVRCAHHSEKLLPALVQVLQRGNRPQDIS